MFDKYRTCDTFKTLLNLKGRVVEKMHDMVMSTWFEKKHI